MVVIAQQETIKMKKTNLKSNNPVEDNKNLKKNVNFVLPTASSTTTARNTVGTSIRYNKSSYTSNSHKDENQNPRSSNSFHYQSTLTPSLSTASVSSTPTHTYPGGGATLSDLLPEEKIKITRLVEQLIECNKENKSLKDELESTTTSLSSLSSSQYNQYNTTHVNEINHQLLTISEENITLQQKCKESLHLLKKYQNKIEILFIENEKLTKLSATNTAQSSQHHTEITRLEALIASQRVTIDSYETKDNLLLETESKNSSLQADYKIQTDMALQLQQRISSLEKNVTMLNTQIENQNYVISEKDKITESLQIVIAQLQQRDIMLTKQSVDALNQSMSFDRSDIMDVPPATTTTAAAAAAANTVTMSSNISLTEHSTNTLPISSNMSILEHNNNNKSSSQTTKNNSQFLPFFEGGEVSTINPLSLWDNEEDDSSIGNPPSIQDTTAAVATIAASRPNNTSSHATTNLVHLPHRLPHGLPHGLPSGLPHGMQHAHRTIDIHSKDLFPAHATTDQTTPHKLDPPKHMNGPTLTGRQHTNTVTLGDNKPPLVDVTNDNNLRRISAIDRAAAVYTNNVIRRVSPFYTHGQSSSYGNGTNHSSKPASSYDYVTSKVNTSRSRVVAVGDSPGMKLAFDAVNIDLDSIYDRNLFDLVDEMNLSNNI